MMTEKFRPPCELEPPSIHDQAITMALAILVARIQGLSKEDRDDLFELVKGLGSADAEERESIVLTMREILEQNPVTVRRMEPPSASPELHPGLSKWIDCVSKRIVKERIEAEMTQTELAEKSGLPQSHISRLESGKHSPSRATLGKIANALGKPLSTFDSTD